METLILINRIISILFVLCYLYQFLLIPVAWLFPKKRHEKEPELHDFAVLICARNEGTVIADLIESLHRQSYPQDRIHIFVMADNCSDDTAEIAQAAGAVVYTRCDEEHIGKGYAMDALMTHLRSDHPEGFDGYFVFDADNLLEPDYIEQINRTFSDGHEIITSYRNSKNYGDNWISAGNALWFLRESRYLNYARFLLGTSCSVSGTGFFFGRKTAEEIGGWPFHLLTEDIEFSVNRITTGHTIAFCCDAVLYDEQPVSYCQSRKQRMRWSRGYLQIFRDYGGALLKGAFRGSFACFDMCMVIMPAYLLSVISVISNISLGIYGAIAGADLMIAVHSVLRLFASVYTELFIIGMITTISEWKSIRTSPVRKVFFAFTFPLFMMTYIPIAFAALFSKPKWEQIRHTVTATQFYKE